MFITKAAASFKILEGVSKKGSYEHNTKAFEKLLILSISLQKFKESRTMTQNCKKFAYIKIILSKIGKLNSDLAKKYIRSHR
jgi:hypothetical protein